MSNVGQANIFSDASEYNTLDFVIARATEKMQTVSIVQVKAVDTGALTVDVQVLVNLVTGANISVPHGIISARPYYRAQGGTSGIILDPAVGDIGVMVFASRDSSAVIAAKSLANPGSQRRFSWSDGIYFGGILNATPTQYLKFAGGGITLLSPSSINLQSPANKSMGPFECTGIATFDTDVHILGDLYLTGVLHGSSAIFSGNVTAASFTGGGGGGGGTVTSVGISTSGSGVVVGGGPITTAGTLTVDLSSTAYAALALAVTALQSISIATGTGLTGGPLTASGTTVSLSAATIASLLPGSPVQGDIAYYNGAAWALLAPGTAGYVLQTNGAGANPSWVASGGGGAAVPTTIAGLVYWFDASTNAITGSGGQVPIIGSPDPVRLPFVAYGVSGGASNVGNTLNSLPVLTVGSTGTPTGAYLIQTAATFNLGSASTVFAVFKPGTSFAGQPILISGGSGSIAFFLGTGGNLKLNNAGVSGIATSTGALTLGTAVQCNYTYTNTTGAWAFRIARAADSSGTTSNTATALVTTLFDYGGGGGEPFIGDFAELIAYTRVLSGPEIAAVEAYLLAKWGV